MKSHVEFINVNKSYGTDNSKRTVIDNTSVKITRGEYVFITGKSGSGKSTFMNMITGIDDAVS